MFRIFILTDKKYVNDSFPSNNFFQVQIPCLVKMSWSIKHFNQRRVKAILDAFFKNSNARIESQARHCRGDINMAVKRNYFFYCHLESTVHHLTSRRVCEHDYLPHSGGNCQLEDLYSLKATQKPYSKPSRSTTGSSKWRLIKLFEASKVSSWKILCIYCVLDFLLAQLPGYLKYDFKVVIN